MDAPRRFLLDFARNRRASWWGDLFACFSAQFDGVVFAEDHFFSLFLFLVMFPEIPSLDRHRYWSIGAVFFSLLCSCVRNYPSPYLQSHY